MRAIAFILVGIAMLAALYGLATLTQATQGAGIVGLACFIAILGRIAQASAETSDLREALKKMIENQQAFIRAQTGRDGNAPMP